MDERKDDEQRERRPAEGVRIIGAEEAQAAIEAGQAAGKRPEDAPKYGDVPPPPEGPRPAIRFPLGGNADPSAIPRPSLSHRDTGREHAGDEADDTTRFPAEQAPEPPAEVAVPGPEAPAPPAAPEPEPPRTPRYTRLGAERVEPPAEEEPPPVITPPGARADLPHWTEPPTGENPRIAVGDDEEADDIAAWQALANQGPRWRGEEASDWEEPDYHDGPEAWADEEARMGALDPDTGVSDLYRFDEPYDDEVAPPTAVASSASGEPTRRPPEPAPHAIRTRAPAPPATGEAPLRKGSGRDVPTAIAVGVGIAALLLVVLKVFENAGGVVIATVVLTLAAMEFFAALRHKGFKPATLLGVVGTAAISWGAYARGEQAVVLITALFVVFTLLWYLTGVTETNQPTVNVGASLLGFAYVGVLGSTAALMLKWPPNHAHGMGIFLGAVIATVAYDVGGFFIGSRAGRTPLAPAISPNKTWEGLIGGMAAAFFVSVIVVTRIKPWDLGDAFALGIVAAIAAPLGDLCESMLKRDLGVKDMGHVLPAHGGVLDRIDAMLFVIPAVYYLAKFLNIA